ncbi:MAG TPA: cupin domain-containing protein [Ginsengibacter sp.]|jgi:mannose-6-phosphate isomerase-like protein (cupin superfamily)
MIEAAGADSRMVNEKLIIMNKVNVEQKLSLFADYWNPRVVGELNGQHVKLVKFQGEFVWHKHDNEDEMFFVVKGQFKMEFRERTVELKENEFLIVPKGVEHRPVAEQEVSVMLFEPSTTLNTGDTESELTKHILEKL